MDTSAPASSELTVKDLLDAGLHFGHQTKRWNPKMKPYVFDKKGGIHIIDLTKSLEQLQKALEFVYGVAARGKKVLFVGTKKQAQQCVKDAAVSCNMPYVEARWLGGTLTNSQTIRKRIKYLRELNQMEQNGTFDKMPKKEVARLRHELEKLRKNLTGIADLEGVPGAMFVVDINREAIAVMEANRLHIPVVAVVDTNCNPDPVDYPIPGNDDAIRAIKLIATALAGAIGTGLSEYSKVAVMEATESAASAAGAEPRRPRGERKPRQHTGARTIRKKPTPAAEAPATEAGAAPAEAPAEQGE
jgi:small subunit ribosomal protein S2